MGGSKFDLWGLFGSFRLGECGFSFCFLGGRWVECFSGVCSWVFFFGLEVVFLTFSEFVVFFLLGY